MQDRFKFRLWAKDIEIYFKGALIYINTDGKLVAEDGVKVYEIDQKAYIVEQCTGLKDKNGKLIYEGDIVDYDGDIGEIFYCKAAMMWGIMQRDWSTYGQNIKRLDTYIINCEVIGNVHENKELLDD